MHKHLFLALTLASISHAALASTPILAPQPVTCVTGTFSSQGNQYWSTISLLLTNTCGTPVNFQNSTITFTTNSNLNTAFWGNFDPLSYPDNNLQITSQPQPNGKFTASLSLHFPNYTGANSVLPNGKSFTIIYGAPKADYVPGSVNVYVSTNPTTGQINLNNVTSKPANVTQNYAVVNISLNGSLVSSVQAPWANVQQVPGLAAGTYSISPVDVMDTSGNTYAGTANPASLIVTAGQTVTSTISYALKPSSAGSINVKNQALPTQISGYTGIPVVTLKPSSGSSVTKNVNWNATTNVGNLTDGATYTFSTPVIVFNGFSCSPTFSPASAPASKNAPPTTNLTYACVPVARDNIAVNVSGVPSTTSSINVTFTPNNSSAPVTQAVNIQGGSGSATVSLVDGTVYTVSSTSITGYSAQYNPQPITARPNGVETITYSKSAGGRIISYIPGWKTPPSATQLASAGYTHMMVAFGVFSTSTPGNIVPAFDTVSASYIQSLHDAGLKVLLSLGGALTSIPNTSVNFHQVLTAAPSPQIFQQRFIQSLESVIAQYGFDGFDIDIEHGITAGGTFSNPQGDIAVLANIINTMHANHPSMLISLTPQVANISATQSFNETWGNYSSLVMQTYQSLSWVGIQLYNTGCALGIDNVCYDPNATNTPNFAVAMATDLLADWPAMDPQGRRTGFQPYISFLNPSQVVLGYPAPNASGQSDGAPVTPNATIKRSIQCLRTGQAGATSCGTYVPPKAYPGIGGVFNWEITYDQNNSYKFATGLKDCVINGNCN